jgi:hypothetical protein
VILMVSRSEKSTSHLREFAHQSPRRKTKRDSFRRITLEYSLEILVERQRTAYSFDTNAVDGKPGVQFKNMKLLLGVMFLATAAFSQILPASQVPAAIQRTFATRFPSVKAVEMEA